MRCLLMFCHQIWPRSSYQPSKYAKKLATCIVRIILLPERTKQLMSSLICLYIHGCLVRNQTEDRRRRRGVQQKKWKDISQIMKVGVGCLISGRVPKNDTDGRKRPCWLFPEQVCRDERANKHLLAIIAVFSNEAKANS